jgi:hypothetical protein
MGPPREPRGRELALPGRIGKGRRRACELPLGSQQIQERDVAQERHHHPRDLTQRLREVE